MSVSPKLLGELADLLICVGIFWIAFRWLVTALVLAILRGHR